MNSYAHVCTVRSHGKGVPFKVLLLCDRDEEAVEMKREIVSCKL